MPRGHKIKYEDNHKIINGELKKSCNRHNEFFPEETEWLPCTIEFFYINEKNKTDGLHPNCIKCEKKKAMKWKRDNPAALKKSYDKYNLKEKHIESRRKTAKERSKNGKNTEYRRNNKEFVNELSKKHRNHDITDKEWKACKNFFNNSCAYCGLPIDQHTIVRIDKIINLDLHKEHVDDNGYNDVRNCASSCQTCNSIKHKKDIKFLFESHEIENFTQERYNRIIQWITEEYKKYIEPKPPYRITRKQNEGQKTYHWELWTVNEKRDFVECIATAQKKAGLKPYIKLYFNITA